MTCNILNNKTVKHLIEKIETIDTVLNLLNFEVKMNQI